jgi:hypothetical protein
LGFQDVETPEFLNNSIFTAWSLIRQKNNLTLKRGQRSLYNDCVTGWAIRGSNPSSGNKFLQNVQTDSLAHRASYSKGAEGKAERT